MFSVYLPCLKHFIALKILFFKTFLPNFKGAQWDPLLNRMGQNGHNFVRDMSLLESQSKGCVNPTFNPAHKWIFAMYLLGCICTVGARARAHPKF